MVEKIYQPNATPSNSRERGSSGSQKNALVARLSSADLFLSNEGIPHATIPVAGHQETWPIKSRKLESIIRARHTDRTNLPGTQAVNEAIASLEAIAYESGIVRPVFQRFGYMEDAIYLDLNNDLHEVVQIKAEGWRIITSPPVKFLRSTTMCELPKPMEEGNINNIRQYINVQSESEFVLIVSWIVATFMPNGPYIILILNGEQGSAKSSTARNIRQLIDPSRCPLRAMPRDERDLFVTAANTRILCFDNISSIPPYMADALCRMATGGGFATRALHTDREETVFMSTCPIILNGIPDIAERADLADRCINIKLSPLPDGERLTEREITEGFNNDHSSMLGAVCDAVACALRRRDEVVIKDRPRMIDAAQWIQAAEPGLGWDEGTFLSAYLENRSDTARDLVDNDVVAIGILRLLEDKKEWEGSATALLADLDTYVSENLRRSKSWPNTPNALGIRIARLSPALRRRGVLVDKIRASTNDRSRRIHLAQATQA